MTRTPFTAGLAVAVALTGVIAFVAGNVVSAQVALAAMAIMILTFKET